MKYLILILLTFNSYADVKVEITNNVNGRKYGAPFKTQLEADAWKAEQINDDSWGKKQRWVLKESQTNCLQERDIIPDMGEMHTECELPVDYTITEVDITDDVNAKKAKKNADTLSMDTIKTKLSDKSAKLSDVIEYLRIKEGI